MSLTGPDEIRDFIKVAEGYMDGAPSIRTLIDSGDDHKLAEAINICILNLKKGDDYARKYAYFVLGQIGDEIALEIFNMANRSEQKQGIIAAVRAAQAAVREAPRSKGFSEKDRRNIIENSYWRYCNPKQARMLDMGLDPNKEANKSSGGCFIATAVYGNELANEVIYLSRFRDDILLKRSVGRIFVSLYYRISPPIANWIERHQIMKFIIRNFVVQPLVKSIRILNN